MEGIKQNVCDYCKSLTIVYTVDFPTHTNNCCVDCIKEYQDMSHTVGGECPLCPDFEIDDTIEVGNVVLDIVEGTPYGVAGVGDKTYMLRELPKKWGEKSSSKVTYFFLDKEMVRKISPTGFVKDEPKAITLFSDTLMDSRFPDRKEWHGTITYFNDRGFKENRSFVIMETDERDKILWSITYFDGRQSTFEKITKEQLVKKFDFYKDVMKASIQVPGYLY